MELKMQAQSIDQFAEQMSQVLPKVVRWFHLNSANALTKSRLNPAQFFVLDIIYELGEQKMSQLAKHLSVSLPAVTRIVDKLYAEKMVERIPSQKDRRVIRISIAAKGEKIVTKFREQRKLAFKDIFGKLCQKDRQDYSRIMLKLSAMTAK